MVMQDLSLANQKSICKANYDIHDTSQLVIPLLLVYYTQVEHDIRYTTKLGLNEGGENRRMTSYN